MEISHYKIIDAMSNADYAEMGGEGSGGEGFVIIIIFG